LEQIDLSEAVDAVKSGGVIAFPTDTFYALGVDALNESAVLRAFEVKRRPPSTPMPVLIAEPEQAHRYTTGFGAASNTLADRFWPGALTIVVDARESVPDVLMGGFDTVGLRIPDHGLARKLIAEAACGITGTSANISGQPPTKDWRCIEESMGQEIDAIVIGECGDASSASTVVRIVDDSIRILRDGPISVDEIERALEEA
jgi:L-threonylcarbamoyladenylate synthase